MRYVIGAALALCACATPYQQMGWQGGFEETRLTRGRYVVHVKVNAHTSAGTAYQYAQRRAQELCAAEGFETFTILGGQQGGQVMASTDANGFTTVSQFPEVTETVQCTSGAAP